MHTLTNEQPPDLEPLQLLENIEKLNNSAFWQISSSLKILNLIFLSKILQPIKLILHDKVKKFGGTLGAQGDLGSKFSIKQKCLRILF